MLDSCTKILDGYITFNLRKIERREIASPSIYDLSLMVGLSD